MTSVATPSRTTGGEPPKPGRHVPGEPGIWLLIFGDMVVFSVVFGVFLFYRSAEPDLFAASQETANRNLGALNTVLLLASSLLVVLATRALRDGSRRHAPRLMAGAIAFGVGFVAVKAVEYYEKLSVGLTPDTNSYFMYYFVLTGLHLAHVMVGLLVLTGLWAMSRRAKLSNDQFAMFEGGACFWHMVDLLWMVIFPLIYLVR